MIRKKLQKMLESAFIKENINKQSKASKTLKKILRIFLSAVLFGVVAVCAAVISKPFAEKYLGKEEETTTTEVVTIARDERESSTEETKPEAPQLDDPEVTNLLERYKKYYGPIQMDK